MIVDFLFISQRLVRSSGAIVLKAFKITYITVVRCLGVYLWLPFRYGEVLLWDLVHREVVDLAIIMTVANRLRRQKRVKSNDE